MSIWSVHHYTKRLMVARPDKAISPGTRRAYLDLSAGYAWCVTECDWLYEGVFRLMYRPI